LIDLATLERDYFERRPDLNDPNQTVSFGTSGQRGSALKVLAANGVLLRATGNRSMPSMGLNITVVNKTIDPASLPCRGENRHRQRLVCGAAVGHGEYLQDLKGS
jgi:hypothetical protein